MVEYLLHHHANPNISFLDFRGDLICFPLHYAVENDNIGMVQILVQHNANLLATNRNGSIPFQLAKSPKVRQFLQNEMKNKKHQIRMQSYFSEREWYRNRVIFIGDTGAGKSSLVGSLLGLILLFFLLPKSTAGHPFNPERKATDLAEISTIHVRRWKEINERDTLCFAKILQQAENSAATSSFPSDNRSKDQKLYLSLEQKIQQKIQQFVQEQKSEKRNPELIPAEQEQKGKAQNTSEMDEDDQDLILNAWDFGGHVRILFLYLLFIVKGGV